MKLYYHKTVGGAEYYCLSPINEMDEAEEGNVRTAVIRTDGNEVEIFTQQLKEAGIKLVID